MQFSIRIIPPPWNSFFDGQKYITTGAARPKVRYDETSCDEPCYYVYDNVIDLRLRYY